VWRTPAHSTVDCWTDAPAASAANRMVARVAAGESDARRPSGHPRASVPPSVGRPAATAPRRHLSPAALRHKSPSRTRRRVARRPDGPTVGGLRQRATLPRRKPASRPAYAARGAARRSTTGPATLGDCHALWRGGPATLRRFVWLDGGSDACRVSAAPPGTATTTHPVVAPATVFSPVACSLSGACGVSPRRAAAAGPCRTADRGAPAVPAPAGRPLPPWPLATRPPLAWGATDGGGGRRGTPPRPWAPACRPWAGASPPPTPRRWCCSADPGRARRRSSAP